MFFIKLRIYSTIQDFQDNKVIKSTVNYLMKFLVDWPWKSDMFPNIEKEY